MIDEWIRQKEAEHIPSIRCNCDDKCMQFQLFGGRMAVREENGSFLMTPEEAKYMPAICYRVADDGITRLPAQHC